MTRCWLLHAEGVPSGPSRFGDDKKVQFLSIRAGGSAMDFVYKARNCSLNACTRRFPLDMFLFVFFFLFVAPFVQMLSLVAFCTLQVVRWEDVVADAVEAEANGNKPGPPSSPAQLRRRCFTAAAEGMGPGRSGKVIRDCLVETGEHFTPPPTCFFVVLNAFHTVHSSEFISFKAFCSLGHPRKIGPVRTEIQRNMCVVMMVIATTGSRSSGRRGVRLLRHCVSKSRMH